jgi:hypothetical protein
MGAGKVGFISYSVRMKTEIRQFLDLCDSCVPGEHSRGWNRTNRTRFYLPSSQSSSANPHNNLFPLLLSSLDHKQFALKWALLIEIGLNYIGFEVLTTGVMKTSRDIAPCSPLKVGRRLRGTRRIHLHGRSVSHACYLLHADFLLGLSFDPEDGGEMFLRNVGWLSTDYTALYYRRI